MALHDNIKRLRKQKGWSQTELAEKIGSHLSHINRIETDKYKPSVDVLVKMADVFDVSIDTLVRDSDVDLKEVTVEDKDLAQRIKLIESLEPEDRHALCRVIDSMLTKQKILKLVSQEGNVSAQVAG
jgi:transcriptional regulator with XRE-family HTH domain